MYFFWFSFYLPFLYLRVRFLRDFYTFFVCVFFFFSYFLDFFRVYFVLLCVCPFFSAFSKALFCRLLFTRFLLSSFNYVNSLLTKNVRHFVNYNRTVSVSYIIFVVVVVVVTLYCRILTYSYRRATYAHTHTHTYLIDRTSHLTQNEHTRPKNLIFVGFLTLLVPFFSFLLCFSLPFLLDTFRLSSKCVL